MNEHDFTALLERATGELAPDVERLVADGTTRGRTRLRRRRIGSGVAVVAAVAAITVGTSLLLNGGDGKPRTEHDFTDRTTTTQQAEKARPQPNRPDRPITLAAAGAPAVFATLLELDVGDFSEPLTGESYPLVDTAEELLVHFRYDGALTTFSISPAHTLASCTELEEANAANESAPAPECTVIDGFEVLTMADEYEGVRADDVWVWNHGYVVSALSYNAAGGKKPNGDPADPISEEPVFDIETLFAIASSEIWFD